MKVERDFTTIEEELALLKKRSENSSISVEELLHILSGKGRSLILILLCLPFCQPLQIPGLSTPFGLAIVFFGLRMAFSKHAWLPKSVLRKEISGSTLHKIADKALWLVNKMRHWVRPRLGWLCHYPSLQIVNGLLISLLGILLALPLPIPLSNLAAAWSIFFIALGLLEDNGVFVLIGYLTSLLTLAFFIAVALSLTLIF